MQSRLKILFLFFLLGLSFNAYAWNALGHMVIADIAYQTITPTTREKLDKMVANFSKEYPQDTSLVKLAPWPDTLHSQNIESFNHWHYINTAYSADGTPLKELVDTDNAIWAVTKIEPVFLSTHSNPFEQARFLAFLVHIVGDLHQPLHTITRVSAIHPDGDRGGNLFTVRSSAGLVTLHKSWDDGAGYLDKDTSETNVNRIAQTIMAINPESSFGIQSTDLDPNSWAKEGYELASTFVYTTPENQIPSIKYTENEKHIVQQQLALAGYRLANLLNLLLTDKVSNA